MVIVIYINSNLKSLNVLDIMFHNTKSIFLLFLKSLVKIASAKIAFLCRYITHIVYTKKDT